VNAAYPNLVNEAEAALMTAETLQMQADRLKENLIDIELAYDALGWREFGSLGEKSWNFKRESLKKIMDLSRRMYLMNPLIRRAVEVQTLYIFAQGFTLKAKHPAVQEVIDDFFDNPKNQKALTSPLAWQQRSDEQQIVGNTFLCLVADEDSGQVRGRTIPVDQIVAIISDPNDSKCTWFYKRVWSDASGQSYCKLYPDIEYTLGESEQAASIKTDTGETFEVEWGMPIYHLKTGGLADMQFGCPEYMSVFTWAIAYKTMLENWATIIQAYARMAMKVTGIQGKSGIAAAKSKLGTAVTTGNVRDTNPPDNTAAWFLASGKMDISAVKTAGATTSAEEGRPLRLMVAAGTGLPDTFFGDSDVGNFATSTTFDRPTELKMVSKQKMWMMVIEAIIRFVIISSARASSGRLNKLGATVEETTDPFDGTTSYRVIMPVNKDDAGGVVGEPISLFVEVAFPNILERNVTERVRAVVAAATLNGSPADGIIPDRRLVCELLLEALGLENVPEVMKALYPNGPETQGYVTPVDRLKVDQDEADAKKALGDAAMKQADAAEINAKKPTPKPSAGGGVPAVTNKK